MKFGERHVIGITGTDAKGRGCGEVAGRPACVHFTLPGEEVEASYVSRRKGVVVLRLEKVLRPSPHRTEPRCPHAGHCGGCVWQQHAYPHQLDLKRDLINRSFEAQGVPLRVDRVEPCPDLWYYRNRMDYCFGPRGELGLKEPGRWNAHVNLDTCFLLSPEAVLVMDIIRDYAASTGLEPWDNRRRSGFFRYLVIREGKNTDERLVTIVTAEGELPESRNLVGRLGPLATAVYHGINPTLTDISVSSRLIRLKGPPYLTERVAGNAYRIYPDSFFQTNTRMADALLHQVIDYVGQEKVGVLLDLYCGVGFFTLGLAGTADRVIGVEADAGAIEAARENATLNGVTNAEFIDAQAEGLVWESARPDTVVIDPPRPGLHPRVCEALLRTRPQRIVYVSCNHRSLARDLQTLRDGFRPVTASALDLFPHSPHVETVALLERQ